jgi:hypothetical protein
MWLVLTNVAVPLLSAIVGGIIGFLGAGHLHARDRKERQLAAARALLVELKSNYEGTQALSKALYNDVPSDWPHFVESRYHEKSVWLDVLPEVSSLLRVGELQALGMAYKRMEVALAQIRDAGLSISKQSTNEEWKHFREKLVFIENHSLREALQSFIGGLDVVSKKVLSQDELKALYV